MLILVNESQNRFPREASAFIDSLPHLNYFKCITALWNRHFKLTDHRCLLHRLRVRLFSAGGYCKLKEKDVQNSTLNERSYIWILEWKLRENVRLACYRRPPASVKGSFGLLVRGTQRQFSVKYLFGEANSA